MDPNSDADKQPTNTSPESVTLTPPVVPAVTPVESPAAPAETPVSSLTAPAEPAAPTGPIINGTPVSPGAGKPKRKRWLLPLVVIVVVLLLAAGYVFGFYLPNTPGNVYKKSLSNTASGYDKLVDYTKAQSQQQYKGFKGDGNFKFSGNGVAGDGTITGQSDGKNGTFAVNTDIMGQKFSVNGRALTASGQTSPDIYLQVTGIKSMLDSYGLESLDSLDGQWLLIDHTLLDSAASSATGESDTKLSAPTAKQVQDALAKVGAVNRDYLFSTDKDTAVLTNNKFLGKSTKDGRQVYGYEVGYNKAHLKAYVTALGKALDSSELNAWAKQAGDGKSLSESMDLTSMQTDIDQLKGTETFHMYADAKTKLISRLEFTDKSDNSTFFITQGYTGGSVYPFSLGVSGSPESNGSLSLKVDTKSNKIDVDFSATPGSKASGSDKTTVTAHLSVTPSNESVKVTAPANAEPITDLLNQLGLGGALGGQTTNDESAALDDSMFLLTQ
jgi:hypothetical protein